SQRRNGASLWKHIREAELHRVLATIPEVHVLVRQRLPRQARRALHIAPGGKVDVLAEGRGVVLEIATHKWANGGGESTLRARLVLEPHLESRDLLTD